MKRIPRHAGKLLQIFRFFAQNRQASVAVMVALVALPIFAMAGFGIDYTSVVGARTRLNIALDAAAVSAIATTMAELQSGVALSTAISDGQAQGALTFKVNAGPYASSVGDTLSIVVARSGQTVSATGAYTAVVATNFGQIFHIPTLTFSGSNSSSLQMPLFLDFYVMVDVSESMGIPSTAAGQTALAKINPDNKSEYPGGCTLACHFTTYKACDGNYCQGFILTRQNGNVNSICTVADTSSCIQLRLDAIGVALTGLLSTAQATEAVTGLSNQFRVGIYPFVVQLKTNYQALSSNLTSTVAAQAQKITGLLDPGNSTGYASFDGTDMGSGGTNINNALHAMYQTLPTTPGDGSNAGSTKPFVFLITDGAQDNQVMYNSNGSWSGSNHATVLTQSYCTQLQTRATLAILYVPYAPISNPNASFANNEDGAANTNIQYIPGSLSACASPGFFYTANTPADITNALQAMFANALQSAPRLVN